jgi:hypothetical protein
MTLELSHVIRGSYDYISSVSGLNSIFSSVFYTSLVLSIILIILIIAIYPAKKNASFWSVIKLFIYTLLTTVFVLYIYGSAIDNNYKKKYNSEKNHEFFGDIGTNNITHSNEFVKLGSSKNVSRDDRTNYMNSIQGLNSRDFNDI